MIPSSLRWRNADVVLDGLRALGWAAPQADMLVGLMAAEQDGFDQLETDAINDDNVESHTPDACDRGSDQANT